MPIPNCPACGDLADGHRVSHLKFDRGTLGPRYSLRYALPCGCRLEAEPYRALVRSLRPPH